MARIIDSEQITVGPSAAVGLTPQKWHNASYCNIIIELAPCRIKADGGAKPTASMGILMNPADQARYLSPLEMQVFMAIATGSTSANLNVTYYSLDQGESMPVMEVVSSGVQTVVTAMPAMTAADGGLATVGSQADPAATVGQPATLIALQKAILANLFNGGPQSNVAITHNQVTTTVHQSAATGTGNGTDAVLNGLKQATVQIFGTAISSTINFLGSVDGTNFFPVAGVRMSDLAVASSTTSGQAGEAWQIDVTGLTKLRVAIAAISGGNITATSGASV